LSRIPCIFVFKIYEIKKEKKCSSCLGKRCDFMFNVSCSQGRVLHPTFDRCFTVREAARSQGFSDNIKFHGAVSSKFRQVGNAVPPPLAEKLGYAIIKSALKSAHSKNKDL
jgi:site-specific DNA-cytosine methylase